VTGLGIRTVPIKSHYWYWYIPWLCINGRYVFD